MDNTNILQRDIKLNKKGAIYALTIIAVIWIFIRNTYVYIGQHYYWLDYGDIPFIISAILFLVYISGPYKKGKAAVIVPIVFLLDTIALFFVSNSYYWNILQLVIIAEILAFVCSLRGFNNKKLFIFSMTAVFIKGAVLLLNHGIIIYNVSFGMASITIKDCLPIIFISVYNIALLIFGANNKIPYVIKPKSKKNKALTPEEELAALKELYDFRKISEEEYLEKRMEIISKI